MPASRPSEFKSALVFTDPTPNAIVNNRIAKRALEVASHYTDMTEDERGEFFDIVLLAARKMISVWKHLDRYCKEEERLREQFAESPDYHVDYGQTLFEEFDEFAVQIKSTLDHIVKAMRPIVGKGWNASTFGDHGEQVVAMLDRNVPKKFDLKVKTMKYIVFSDVRLKWLDAIIGARDRVNHFQKGGIPIKTFSVFRSVEGRVEMPRWSKEQSLRDAMTGLWYEFFFLVEDFLMCALHFRLSGGFEIMRKPEPITSANSPWHVMHPEAAAAIVKHLSKTQKPKML